MSSTHCAVTHSSGISVSRPQHNLESKLHEGTTLLGQQWSVTWIAPTPKSCSDPPAAPQAAPKHPQPLLSSNECITEAHSQQKSPHMRVGCRSSSAQLTLGEPPASVSCTEAPPAQQLCSVGEPPPCRAPHWRSPSLQALTAPKCSYTIFTPGLL